jgi:hypothetical protein
VKLNPTIKSFAAALLQDRLDGKLRTPDDVLTHARRNQPKHGFSNDEWRNICDFIMLLKPADNIPAARKLADEHSLILRY